MIQLYEQFDGYIEASDCEKDRSYHKTVKRHNEDATCFDIKFDEKEQKHRFSTSYYVGVDWIIENRLSIYVQPKQNKHETEIDYLSMLFEAMQEQQNFEHLDGLCEIDFDKPSIEIEQKQDLLTPFLIVQYLQILKRIVQKGLMKTYYPITKKLEAKVKGKILVNQTIKTAVVKGQMTKTICRYDEFGFNGEENKILKKALLFSQHALSSVKISYKDALNNLLNFIKPAFAAVSNDVLVEKIKNFKPNPMYREYEKALKLALLILKRFSYNITQTEATKIITPPFWIDMSKLFELYVFKKLREVFPNQNEVLYHEKAHYQELDFLINSKPFQMVVDTKYKPRYENHAIVMEDMRQVCGYARLESVYNKLGLKTEEEKQRNLDCLIIYSSQNCDDKIQKDCLKSTKESGYVNFYKIGIKLPEIQHSKRND